MEDAVLIRAKGRVLRGAQDGKFTKGAGPSVLTVAVRVDRLGSILMAMGFARTAGCWFG